MENTREDREVVRVSLIIPADNCVHVRELRLDEHLQCDVMMVIVALDVFSLDLPV